MYDLVLHKNLNPAVWSTYSFDRQILMIANEVNRFINGVKSELDAVSLRECLERAFELCDLTIACQTGSRRKELLRWRELFGAYYLDSLPQYEYISDSAGIFKTLLLNTRATEALID